MNVTRLFAPRRRHNGWLSPLLALTLLSLLLPGVVLAQSDDETPGPGEVEFARLTLGPYLIAWDTALWTSERRPDASGTGVQGIPEQGTPA